MLELLNAKKRNQAYRSRPVSGFTLIEVLVVVAIISVLAAMLVLGVFNARKRTVDAAVESCVRQVLTWVAAANTGVVRGSRCTA